MDKWIDQPNMTQVYVVIGYDIIWLINIIININLLTIKFDGKNKITYYLKKLWD